jgi:hypothetical protein
MKFQHLILSIIVCLLSVSGFTQSKYYVDFDISNTTPTQNEEIQITYKLMFRGNNIKLHNPRFQITKPKFGDNFKILKEGQPNNRSFNFGGSGGMTIYQYLFVLKANKTGNMTIPPMSIAYEGKTYTSKSASLKVLKSNAPSGQQMASQVFIQTAVSKQNIFKGEEFFVTYKLYSKHELVQIAANTPPLFEGFTTKPMDANAQNRVRNEKLNGQTYYTLDLTKTTLNPLKGGEHTIVPYKMTVVANVPTGRVVNDFFLGRRNEVKRKRIEVVSKPLNLTINELPANRPAGFTGAVGKFNMQATLSETVTVTGEPLTYKVKVSGDGNLKFIEEPKLELPPNFETYDPKVKQTATTKTFEYLLIPQSPGDFTLAPHVFSYFDVKKKEFVTITSDAFTITVDPSEGYQAGNVPTVTGINKEDVELLGQDIRYIKTEEPEFFTEAEAFYASPTFFALMGAPFLFFVPLIFIKKHRDKTKGNTMLIRNRKATKVARKRLSVAKKHLQNQDNKAFHDEVMRGLWGYLSDKLSIPQSDLSRENINDILKQKAVDEQTMNDLLKTMDACEIALFAPSMASHEMEVTYQSAINLISKLENQVG